MVKDEKERRIYTTHNRPNSKPRMLAKPAMVNGIRALVYEKDGKIDNYISLEELNTAMYATNLPAKELDF